MDNYVSAKAVTNRIRAYEVEEYPSTPPLAPFSALQASYEI